MIKVAGYIKKIRNLGKINFLILNCTKPNIKFESLYTSDANSPSLKKVVLENNYKDSEKLFESDFTNLQIFCLQVVIKNETNIIYNKNNSLKHFYVGDFIEVTGRINPAINSKEFEIEIAAVNVIQFTFNENSTTKFNSNTSLEQRLDYLKFSNLRRNLILYSSIKNFIQQTMLKNGFIDITTPVLTAQLPEGAKNFYVKGHIENYSLVQSPQIYKQALIGGGIFKYFQFAKCFRDEDLRNDRQPEFTQLDIEIAFSKSSYVFYIVENLIRQILQVFFKIEKVEFKVLPYKDSIKKYFNDKPDLRSEFKSIIDGSGYFFEFDENIEFDIEILKRFNNKSIEDTIIKWGNKIFYNKEKIDEEFANKIKYVYSKIKYGVFSSCEKVKSLIEINSFILNNSNFKNVLKFVWIVDKPLFELDQQNKLSIAHSPFVKVHESKIKLLDSKVESDLLEITTYGYDLVLNGVEIMGGSERNTDVDIFIKTLQHVGLSQKEIESFNFFKNLLPFLPPHSGIAMGFERFITMLLDPANGIRDVIPFPKTNLGKCVFSMKENDIN